MPYTFFSLHSFYSWLFFPLYLCCCCCYCRCSIEQKSFFFLFILCHGNRCFFPLFIATRITLANIHSRRMRTHTLIQCRSKKLCVFFKSGNLTFILKNHSRYTWNVFFFFLCVVFIFVLSFSFYVFEFDIFRHNCFMCRCRFFSLFGFYHALFDSLCFIFFLPKSFYFIFFHLKYTLPFIIVFFICD